MKPMSEIIRIPDTTLPTDDIGKVEEDRDIELLEKLISFIHSIPEEVAERFPPGLYDALVMAHNEIDAYAHSIPEDESGLDEASAKKVVRNKSLKLQRSRAYRRNKSKIKRQQKLFRKTAKFRRFKTKQKLKAKTGRTSTGKRKRTYVN